MMIGKGDCHLMERPSESVFQRLQLYHAPTVCGTFYATLCVAACEPPEMTRWVCAVERRRFPVGVSPTRQPLQPEATGAVTEVTKWLKPSVSVSRYTVTARVCRP